MILKELFGNTSRIKILEELLSKWGEFLSVEEISRMSDISRKSVYNHLNNLEEIGILEIRKEGSKKFKLKEDDERALALVLIESNEYSRQLNKIEVPYKSNTTDNLLTNYEIYNESLKNSELLTVEPKFESTSQDKLIFIMSEPYV